LLLDRGADIERGPENAARVGGHPTMAAWQVGWARYLSEPRYALVVLRELVAGGRARRRGATPPLRSVACRPTRAPTHFDCTTAAGVAKAIARTAPSSRDEFDASRDESGADSGKERVLDFLFVPGDQQANKPSLPDDVFSIIARYYWCGEP